MRSDDQPDVSIIMPIKNPGRFLVQALDSIVAQTHRSYEIIIIDGGSTDDGPAVARRYPQTRCIDQDGAGLANAWNCGIAAARGRYIGFLDSDDLWTPNKLAGQLAILASDAAIEYAYGRVQFFQEPGCALPPGFRPDLLEGSHLNPMTGSSLVRRDVIDRLGPFREDWQIASDLVWIAALRETCIGGILDEVVLRKRLHTTNLSTQAWPVLKSELFQWLKGRVDRHRDGNPAVGATRPA